MAPESDARERAIYDPENVEPRRPRRAAADWGVNEDIFDRMPSRFGRVERRPEQQEIVLRRDVDDANVAVIERDGGRFEREEVVAWTRETGRGGDDREARRVETVARIRGEVGRGAARRDATAWTHDDAGPADGRRDATAWARDEAGRGEAWAHGDEVERVTLVRGTVKHGEPVARVRS